MAFIIINADDFGFNDEINKAITQSVIDLPVKSVSMMVNMEGFQEGVRMLHAGELPVESLGIHINLTEGFPITEDIKKCDLFCDAATGEFIFVRSKALFYLNSKTKKAVEQEVEAQIRQFLTSGRHPAHIDSHHHIHTEWPLLSIFIRLAKKYKIQRIRIARNMGESTNFIKKIYRHIMNRYLRYSSGLTITEYFGDIADFKKAMKDKNLDQKYVEVMVHPMYNDHHQLVDADQNDLQQKIKNSLGNFL